MRRNKRFFTDTEKIHYFRSRINNKQLKSGKRLYAKGRLLQLEHGLFEVVHADNSVFYVKKDLHGNVVPDGGKHFALTVGKNKSGDFSLMEFTSLDNSKTGKLDPNKIRKMRQGLMLPMKKWMHGFKRPTSLRIEQYKKRADNGASIQNKDFSTVRDLHPLAIPSVIAFKNKGK